MVNKYNNNILPDEILLYIAQFFDNYLDKTTQLIDSHMCAILTNTDDIYNTLWNDINKIRMDPDIRIIYNEWKYGSILKSIEESHIISKEFALLSWHHSFAVAFWMCIYH